MFIGFWKIDVIIFNSTIYTKFYSPNSYFLNAFTFPNSYFLNASSYFEKEIRIMFVDCGYQDNRSAERNHPVLSGDLGSL